MIDLTSPVTVQKSGGAVYQHTDQMQLVAYGKILLVRKDHCVVLVSAGPQAGKKVTMPLTYPATINGVVYCVDKEVAVAAPVTDQPKREKPAPGESKIARCKAIYAAFSFTGDAKADKAAIVKRFVEEVGCTPAGANTYYITCTKS